MLYRQCLCTTPHVAHLWGMFDNSPLWCNGVVEHKEKLGIAGYPDPVLESSLKEEFSKNKQGGSMDPTQFRNLVKEVSRRDISTEEATNFLKLFKDQLEEAVLQAKRNFIQHYFGSRIQTFGPK